VGALIVYDITRHASFENLDSWLDEFKKHADPNAVVVLVGNKCDLEHNRGVFKEEAKEYASEHGLYFLETSALSTHNIDAAFHTLLNQFHFGKKHLNNSNNNNGSGSSGSSGNNSSSGSNHSGNLLAAPKSTPIILTPQKNNSDIQLSDETKDPLSVHNLGGSNVPAKKGGCC